ncbi:MAG: alpha/beta hydrolase [Steroidobacteraceae bacterium]
MSAAGSLAASGIGQRIAALPLRHATVEGGVISWREAGQGEPLVLLHGISSGSASWLQQLEHLSQSFRVMAWDAPGYGESAPLPVADPRAEDYALVLHRMLSSQCGPMHLVGHSLGALVAAAYARAYPERLLSLSLLNPAVGYGSQAPEVREAKLNGRLEQVRRLGPEGLAEERAPALVSARASPAALEILRWNARRLTVGGYEQAARMLASGDLLRDLADIALPVMVLTGTADDITPPGSADEAARAGRAVSRISLDGVGHASYVEDPQGVDAALAAFIREHGTDAVEQVK